MTITHIRDVHDYDEFDQHINFKYLYKNIIITYFSTFMRFE